MTVYVDDMKANFGRMKMCHMVADTREELLAMADTIGVQRKWLQYPGTWKEHFDIALTKRAKAVQAGAVEIEAQQLVSMLRRKQITGSPGLGSPEDAIEWYLAYGEQQRAAQQVAP
jgi:hypothetical protein